MRVAVIGFGVTGLAATWVRFPDSLDTRPPFIMPHFTAPE